MFELFRNLFGGFYLLEVMFLGSNRLKLGRDLIDLIFLGGLGLWLGD